MRRNRPNRRHGTALDWGDRLKRVGRAAAVVSVAALLFALTLRSSIAEVFQSARPARTLAWVGDHAGASAAMAHRAIVADRVEDGRRWATRAIAREPIEASAYSALALAEEAAGGSDRSRPLMALAHRISRREPTTELWFIRQAIRGADYATAIRHFDIAMRTSARRFSDLMPLLVAATADPRMVSTLAPVLARNPDWKTTFLMSLALRGPDPLHVAQLSRGRLDPRQAGERAVFVQLIQRLVNERQYDLAWSFYREARPGTPDQAAASIRDPNYAAGSGFPPMDWQLAEQPDLSALRETRRDGRPGFALVLIAEGGRTGEVARQLVRLPAGAHRIRFETGAVPDRAPDRPQLSLACAGGAAPFYQARAPRGGSGPQRVTGAFTVPAGCRWQVLTIGIGSNETPSEFPWIAEVGIFR